MRQSDENKNGQNFLLSVFKIFQRDIIMRENYKQNFKQNIEWNQTIKRMNEFRIEQKKNIFKF